MHSLVQFLSAVFASKGYPFKNIFDFTTNGHRDCVAAVERLPALHYIVDLFSCPLGSLWNFETLQLCKLLKLSLFIYYDK